MTEVDQESANMEKWSIDELIRKKMEKNARQIWRNASGSGALYSNGAWFGFPVNKFAERYIEFMQMSLKNTQ